MSKASVLESDKRKRIALIDADSVVYGTALGAEMHVATEEGQEDTYFQIKSEEEAYSEVIAKLEALIGDVQADDAIVCLTTTKCFRYHVLPTYKANRAFTHRPSILLDLHMMLQERRPFGVLAVRGLEADDVCAISSGHLQMAPLKEPIVVSIDKDLLSVPGMVYSTLRAKEGIVEVTLEMADRAFLYQTLVGDPVDGYTGCVGIGPKKASKLLDTYAHATMDLQWAAVVELYKKRGQSAEDALTQARVARIVRSKEWDASTRQVHLWSPGEQRYEAISLDNLPHLRDLK